MDQENDYHLALQSACKRLRDKGLLAPGDSLSVRLPGEAAFLLLQVGRPGSQDNIERCALGDAQPASGDMALRPLHGLVYALRADVGAVLLDRQTWATALYQLAAPMPGVFDEQIRHLGRSVAVLPPEALVLRAGLASGANAYALGGQALCLGMTLERLVLNAELLEKCAKAFVLAHSTGLAVGRIPWLVRWVANGRLKKDQKRAAQSYAQGQAPARSTAY